MTTAPVRRRAGARSGTALAALCGAFLVLGSSARSADPVGLTHREVRLPGGGDGHLLTVDLSHAELRVLDSRDHGGGNLTAREFADRSGATAVVNGSFFDVDGSPMGLLVVDGEERVPLRPVDWGVFAVGAGAARIVHTRDWAADGAVRQALQSGPRLVVDGETVPLKAQSARRTAVCTRGDGKVGILVVGESVDAAAMASFLRSEGCEDALNLDGGPSSQLYLRAAGREIEEPGGYGVPIALGVFVKGTTELRGGPGCGCD